jgi:FMN hydrolase / 5-amino-6-(5-phospho-D-ribitylamino)uracil phosphatase
VIEAVVFDWGGTLTPWLAMDPHASWRAYAAALHPDDTTARPSRAPAQLIVDW